jgi:hypothetical protein
MLYRIIIFLIIFFPTLSYYGAGILPYAKYNNNLYFLLGSIKGHNNKLSGFGGGKELEDKENPIITAAREATEELTFIYDSNENFEKLLNNTLNLRKSSTFLFFLDRLNEKTIKIDHDGFCIYLIEIKYDDKINETFEERVNFYQDQLQIHKCWNETSKIFWISAKNIYSIKNLYKPFQELIKSNIFQDLYRLIQ